MSSVRQRITSVLTGGAVVSTALVALATPAQAKSFVVFEAGRAKISAGLVQCKQFIMERDGADIKYFHVQPRIEKEVTKTYRYRDPKTGKNRVGSKKVWAAVGGTSNPARENRSYGGRNQNARVATGSFQRPSGYWTFSRHVEGHGNYRCVGFVSATAIDSSGKLHKVGPVKMEGPPVNSTHR